MARRRKRHIVKIPALDQGNESLEIELGGKKYLLDIDNSFEPLHGIRYSGTAEIGRKRDVPVSVIYWSHAVPEAYIDGKMQESEIL
jgi:hypothetical protein